MGQIARLGYSILSSLKSATFHQSAITFLGTAINGILGAVFYILVARFLGPASFGLLMVTITLLTLISDIGDLGTDTGLVNFVGRNIKKKPFKAYRFLKLGLKIKLMVWLIVLGVGFVFSDQIALLLFKKVELTNPLRLAFFGVGGFLFFSFITHALQGMQKFWAWSGIQIGTNAVRVVIIIILLVFGIFNLTSTLTVYIATPFLGFLVGMSILPKKFLRVDKEMSVGAEFFHYNKWVAAFTLVAAVSSRLDTFISARLLSAFEVGLYSAASQLTVIIPQIVVAMGTVISPKMASMGNKEVFVKYLKKTQIMILGVAFLGIVTIPIVAFLVPYVFGSEYLGSIPIFVILFLGELIFLISVPVHSAVFYYFSYPRLFFWLSLVHLTITVVGGLYLISLYGVLGAAYIVVIGNIVNFLIPLLWVLKKLKIKSK
ncbi:hypothetical protein A3D84_05185 [Candidatus Woesebacteria bacterium RIFCSPHIGHO2_02_FULL_42_20]|uniref:Polysaccharide biosynthesis protein C-terminal domain-containing protein n=1 Tax=Candidatus Woesebacteria bacterium RIFCSPHIGHO2_12_FULL_41_24 TaxID=1802510 RepID=A0A1F8ARA1_9BACT|nr:MAG: hypothetical protein A2W15_04825 [Candidatus Woesebacteria bacterium RBG_16_41_13]OGM30622.1 MAG: hypothetical protein A2873_00720 [Candidatus Woesebacteria bacterium RIFCSPHIGHO2_01_FULL_42_80]OGM34584.1 MAG: hypothetical protein A3D84_05185 [Candidatus Woesebacteria bacterium RIFCSPHIGHO2_02_FULL_42_20]OGM53818.1 MAG: hypothetical protein A3E44_05370 [Candidatus Woesebacteria bacterium RIFCSPHIGHO2_12_FULL_41_24]OGM66010.1 MAG: hypothetical protein A2969_03465 [Candidatus Woesebacteri